MNRTHGSIARFVWLRVSLCYKDERERPFSADDMSTGGVVESWFRGPKRRLPLELAVGLVEDVFTCASSQDAVFQGALPLETMRISKDRAASIHSNTTYLVFNTLDLIVGAQDGFADRAVTLFLSLAVQLIVVIEVRVDGVFVLLIALDLSLVILVVGTI